MRFPFTQLTALVGTIAPTGEETNHFDWDTITPSTDLHYSPCYGRYQCARLVLPLDYRNASSSETVTIAIAKLPATVPITDPAFAGTVFTQPGGPGVPGTLYLRGNGKKLRDVIDVGGKQHYELLAFDPRGIGNSVPTVNCFPGLLGYMRAQMRETEVITRPDGLPLAVAAGKADGMRCAEEHGEFLKFVGTPYVVRDMVEILDKIEDERERAKGKIEKKKEEVKEEQNLELRGEGGKVGKKGRELPRLQYIGISYGTILGSYFASMFPGRVGRMVLDGVVDAHGWQNGDPSGLADVDDMFEAFIEGCFENHCALRWPEDKESEDIFRHLYYWFMDLEEEPLIIPAPDGNRKLVFRSDVAGMIFSAMYHPLTDFRPLAELFNASISGDHAPLSEAILAAYQPIPDAIRSNFSGSGEVMPGIGFDGHQAIACADQVDITDRTRFDWRASLDDYARTSMMIGGPAFMSQTMCAGWKMRPSWVFRGPFTTPEPIDGLLEEGRPAAPLLFLSNRVDPVTPLAHARIMRESFPRAGLVVQESMGHCATLGALGPCVKDIVAEYFATGKVPQEEVSCEPTRGVWDE